jgi:hypothetical protein
MRDAYGRKRSSRSIPTGPGSRGGRWHDPEFRSLWYQAWRRNHPDYRERERTRMIRARLLLRIRAIAETGTDAGYTLRNATRLTTDAPVLVSTRRAAA